MSNLNEKLSILTTIPEKSLSKLTEKSYYVVSDIILEDIMNDKDVSEIDIGIGTIIIQHSGDSIKYKFIPSKNLDITVKSTIINKKNTLEYILEQTLKDKVTNTYKDLF